MSQLFGIRFRKLSNTLKRSFNLVKMLGTLLNAIQRLTMKQARLSNGCQLRGLMTGLLGN